MSISIGGLGNAFPDPAPQRSDRTPQAPAHGGQLPVPERSSVGQADTSASNGAGELWELLSADERAYYLRNSITSAATYDIGRGRTTSSLPGAGARVGGRLDVRA